MSIFLMEVIIAEVDKGCRQVLLKYYAPWAKAVGMKHGQIMDTLGEIEGGVNGV